MNLNKNKKWFKKFRGISIVPIRIQLNEWDGYGIHILILGIFKGGSITEKSLLFLNIYPEYSNGGKEIRIMGGFFFMYRKLWSKVLRNKKERCEQCDDLCQTKEFYKGDIPYCSEGCRDF